MRACGPRTRTDRQRGRPVALWWAQNNGCRRDALPEFPITATLFACGAGDGNRTRTVSLGRVPIPPCSPALQRYWRPQLTAGGPYRPGLVARVWPGSLGSRAETYARCPELFGLGGR